MRESVATERLERLERERRQPLWDAALARTIEGAAPIVTIRADSADSAEEVRREKRTDAVGTTITEPLCDRQDRPERFTKRLEVDRDRLELRNRRSRTAVLAAAVILLVILSAQFAYGVKAKAQRISATPLIANQHRAAAQVAMVRNQAEPGE